MKIAFNLFKLTQNIHNHKKEDLIAFLKVIGKPKVLGTNFYLDYLLRNTFYKTGGS